MLWSFSDVFHSASRHAIHTQSWVKCCLPLLFLVCSCLVRSQMAGFTDFNNAMRVQNTDAHIMRQLSTPLSDIWQAILLLSMQAKINLNINSKLYFDHDSSFSWRKTVCFHSQPPSPSKKNNLCFMHNLYGTVTKSCCPLCWPLHARCSSILSISPHTDLPVSSTGWPFQLGLCPRWILIPLVSPKLDFFFLSA